MTEPTLECAIQDTDLCLTKEKGHILSAHVLRDLSQVSAQGCLGLLDPLLNS